jgi:cephalosporin hydroxylase
MDHVVYTQHYTHLEAAHTGGTSPEDPDTLDVFTEIVDTIGPCHVLEIGMNQGGSALAFLLCGCSVTSIDPTHKPLSVAYLQSIFNDQFSYYNISSGELD